MRWVNLTPAWDASDTQRCVVLSLILFGMTIPALILRARAQDERQRALAADYRARTVGWWLLVAVFMPAILAGGGVVLAVFALASLVTWFEFTRVTRVGALRWSDGVWALLLVAAHAAALAGRLPISVLAVDVGAIVLIAAVSLEPTRQGWAARAGWRILGFLICIVALGAAPALALRFGVDWLCFVVVVVQAGDVLQYIFGKAFGRRALAPWLSPNKTWEGLLGGVLATACLGAALSPLIERGRMAGFCWGLGIALAGSAGGLAMSAVKRHHDAKDFGAWLPGHGGLLDRVDSLCGAAVFTYLWLAW